MPRNNLIDLHNILMEQLERINETELTDADLDKEISRSKALGDIAKVIVSNSQVILDAQKESLKYGMTETMNSILIDAKNEK